MVLPIDFAIEPTSSLGLGTPSTFGRDLTLERTSAPPATAAAAAPTATAGPLAAPAALPALAMSESPELFAFCRLRLLPELPRRDPLAAPLFLPLACDRDRVVLLALAFDLGVVFFRPPLLREPDFVLAIDALFSLNAPSPRATPVEEISIR